MQSLSYNITILKRIGVILMRALFYFEIVMLLSALLYTLRVFWPVKGELFGQKSGEILISIRNRHNLKICAGIIILVTLSLMFVF